jgi:hypothetical protein
MIYKRGKNGIYSYRFRFAGRMIHESARTRSKTLAREAERQRRRELEERINNVKRRGLPPAFGRAAEEWQANRAHRLAANTQSVARLALKHLLPVFGPKLLCDITPQDITDYQRIRLKSGAQGRTVNIEIAALRQVLKASDLWLPLASKVRMLRERHDVAKALTPQQEQALLVATAETDSACHTATVLALNTAMRKDEIRLARIRDEKAYAETYAALGPLIDVAREAGTHVMLTHHAGKSAKPDAIDAPLGSTAIGGAVCTVVHLKRSETMRTLQTVQRIGQDIPETVLQFDVDTRSLFRGEEKTAADLLAIGETILEFLKGIDEPKTESEIDDAVEGKTGQKRKALRQLVTQGNVSREGVGRKGDPYKYQFSFPCSPYMPGTREQETEKLPDDRINIGAILVPEVVAEPQVNDDSVEQVFWEGKL